VSRALRNFFVELSTNPVRMETFELDPAAALESTNLSEEDKQLVMSRDLVAIASELDLQGPPSSETGGARKKPGKAKNRKKTVATKKKSTPKPKK
jgi:hypothetical protein